MKRRLNKKPVKSNHKHKYELVEIRHPEWFTHKEVCKICGKERNKLHIEDKGESNQ